MRQVRQVGRWGRGGRAAVACLLMGLAGLGPTGLARGHETGVLASSVAPATGMGARSRAGEPVQAVALALPGPGIIDTVAGTGMAGYSGDGGPASAAKLYVPVGVAVDSAGNLFIADEYNNVVREVQASNGKIITVAGNGVAGYTGDGGKATQAELHNPTGVAVDSAGNLFIADYSNHVVREVDASSGTIDTVAGTGTFGDTGDGGKATQAELFYPRGVAVDSAGNLFIADASNHVVREVQASSGIIIRVAGNGTPGYTGDGGKATQAELYSPYGIALDAAGDLFIADTFNRVVREVEASNGKIITVAGNGTAGYTGDGSKATLAELSGPQGVAVDSAGNLFIADYGNQRVREVDASSGTIETVAGNGTAGYTGDGSKATRAELNYPWGVALDSAGNLFIGDRSNNVVRVVGRAGSPAPTATPMATATSTASAATATTAPVNAATATSTPAPQATASPRPCSYPLGVQLSLPAQNILVKGSVVTLRAHAAPRLQLTITLRLTHRTQLLYQLQATATTNGAGTIVRMLHLTYNPPQKTTATLTVVTRSRCGAVTRSAQVTVRSSKR